MSKTKKHQKGGKDTKSDYHFLTVEVYECLVQ